MSPDRSADIDARIGSYVERIESAAHRCARAGEAAARHEQLMADDRPSVNAHHRTMARIYRQTQARHTVTMALYSRYALFLSERRFGDPHAESLPRFVDTLGAVASSPSVCVGLCGVGSGGPVIASDRTARTAYDREVLVGEGPAHACEVDGPLIATGEEIGHRWRGYAAAVEPLGVRMVAAVPLRVSDVPLGTLTAFGTSAQPIEADLHQLVALGDAVAHVLVQDAEIPTRDGHDLIGSAEFDEVVHQAAGMVSVQFGCAVNDALALLRAHAYAAGADLHPVARAVVAGDLRLDR